MIVGVIAPVAGTALGSFGDGDAKWTARLRLICWQDADGTVAAERLTLVSREMPRDKAARLINGFSGFDVVRCERRGRTLLSRPVRVVPGSGLAATLERIRRPVVVDHELGRFTNTVESDGFDGELSIDGSVDLQLSTTDPAVAGRLLDRLAAALTDRVVTRENILGRAATDLLEPANGEWRAGAERLSDTEFRRRLGFHTLVVDDEGEFEAYCDDDGVFADHVVLVRGSLTAGPITATIAS
ncbi:MAG: DUF2262 domain-containing protein [Stackebrandtia sp.]